MEIRILKPEDLPLLAQGARDFYASSKFLKGFEMSRFVDAWTKLLTGGAGVIFAFIDEKGEAQGAIGGVVYPELYSAELVASEFFWFVRAKHRGAGINLFYEFEKWAKDKHASQIRMTHLCDLMPDGLKWLYGELGFDAIEINYAKELKP